MAKPFEILVETEDGIYMVAIKGALDTATIDQFVQVMLPIMAEPRPQIILCCRELTYMNSRTLGYLTQYHRNAMVKQGRMIFWGLSDRLVKAFDRLRVKDSLFICSSKDEALGKFAD